MAEKIEIDLELLGITGIEDKLQVGVPVPGHIDLTEGELEMMMKDDETCETCVYTVYHISIIMYDAVFFQVLRSCGFNIYETRISRKIHGNTASLRMPLKSSARRNFMELGMGTC